MKNKIHGFCKMMAVSKPPLLLLKSLKFITFCCLRTYANLPHQRQDLAYQALFPLCSLFAL